MSPAFEERANGIADRLNSYKVEQQGLVHRQDPLGSRIQGVANVQDLSGPGQLEDRKTTAMIITY